MENKAYETDTTNGHDNKYVVLKQEICRMNYILTVPLEANVAERVQYFASVVLSIV